MLTGVLKHGLDQQCMITVNKIKEKVRKMNKKIRDIWHFDIKFNAVSILTQFINNINYVATIKVKELHCWK